MSKLQSWEIVSETLKLLKSEARVGVTTKYLDEIAEKLILSLGGTPYNKGYHPDWSKSPFPASVCLCVNSVLVHGIPSDYILKDGDTLICDLGVKKDGVCGDAALTVGIGELSRENQKLLDTTILALSRAISVVKDGAYIRDIGYQIESTALEAGFVSNRGYTGHHIGKEMHEDPPIPNYFDYFNEERLKEGTMICIEPILTKKDKHGIKVGDWEVVTKDGRNASCFEHQILVTKDGCKVLTTHI